MNAPPKGRSRLRLPSGVVASFGGVLFLPGVADATIWPIVSRAAS